MTADCPTCHAPVEFRFDDSFVRVCEHCHSAVLRTDRGVESLGQLADLAAIDSPLHLFAEGHDGRAAFLLVGMAQLRHAQGGVWQEWYAKLDGGAWGWLSEAQGRYYMTYEAADVAAPAYASLAPGATIALAQGGGAREYTVGEVGTATYASARGEIPYRLVPEAAFRYADLAAADGSFVTIDYGDPADGGARPTVYAGRQLALAELALTGGEVEAPTGARIAATRIACPNCNGSLDIRAPGESLRVACPYCGAMVSLEHGAPSVIAAKTKVPRPAIALGAKGTFADGELQIIGFLRRSAHVGGEWYPFDEYLLHAPAVGFRWLVCSDGHWSYVQPIAPGAVGPGPDGQRVYDDVTFKLFQASDLRVDAVLGEMYWRVTAGELVRGKDYIAPPAMLSLETAAGADGASGEESWSLSSYLTPAQVKAALGQPDLVLPAPEGIAPNQPPRRDLAAPVTLLGLVAVIGLGLVLAATASHKQVMTDSITVPATGSAVAVGSGSGSDAVPAAYFSAPFQLAGGKNIEIAFDASLNNDWAYAAADLVEDKTGAVTSVDTDLESYSGVEDGESWSEGDARKSEILGPVPPGTYLLRVESQHGGPGSATLRVTIEQGVFRWLYWLVACGVMFGVYLIAKAAGGSMEKLRWADSSTNNPSEVTRPKRPKQPKPGKPGARTAGRDGGGLQSGLARLDHWQDPEKPEDD